MSTEYQFRNFNPKAKIISQFLNDQEIFEIERMFRQYNDTRIVAEAMSIRMSTDTSYDTFECRSHYWWPGESIKKKLIEFVTSKIIKVFSEDVVCENWHILNSFRPYPIHSDSYDEDDHEATALPDNYDYAYTFLIPLADYDCHTIVFNETSNFTKNPQIWIKKTNPTPKNEITQEEYLKYFTHNNKEIVKYLSIDTIFPWKKGDLLSMSRHAYHCSDDFYSKNILEKRALVGWSYWKRVNNDK